MLLNCGVGEDSWASLGNPKGNQLWILIGRTDAEAPILWLPDANCWLTGKNPDAGKDWKQEEKGTEDEMVGWHHRLNGHEFEQAPGVGDGPGGLACYNPWGRKELDMTDWLNWTELKDQRPLLHCTFSKPYCLLNCSLFLCLPFLGLIQRLTQ